MDCLYETRTTVKRKREVGTMVAELAVEGELDVRQEIPGSDFSQDVEVGCIPEEFEVEGHRIFAFYRDCTDTWQVIVNGQNWNCRVCYEPPSENRKMFWSANCAPHANLTHPHVYCETCHGKLDFCGFKCNLPLDWKKVEFPEEVAKRLKLVELAKRHLEGKEKRQDVLEELERLTMEEFKQSLEKELALGDEDEKQDFKELDVEWRNEIRRQQELNREIRAAIKSINDALRIQAEEEEARELAELNEYLVNKQRYGVNFTRVSAIAAGDRTTCGFCYRVLKNPAAKYRHIEKKHLTESEESVKLLKEMDRAREFLCWEKGCTYRTRDIYTIKRHMKSRNCPMRSQEERYTSRICEVCNKLFRDSYAIRRHQKSCKPI